jgi:phosphate starvation-inducible PhoH-like protein
MKEPNRTRKNDIKYNVTLNDEQKQAKQLIIDNQIVIVTGRAGSGKSLVGAQTAVDFLNKKQCEKILVTRSAIEVGKSLGFLPGNLDEKFNPYMEALIENLYKCMDPIKIDAFVKMVK